MNRTAAVLAALLAATSACGPAPVPPYTDVTFYWQFRDQDGNLYGDGTAAFPGCDVANVDQVRVSMTGPAGSWTQTVPCIAVNGMPGASFTALPAGSYTWFLEGMRLGFPVFAVEGAGNVVNFPFFYPVLDAIYPNMDLFYQLPPGVNCTGISEIQFELDNLDARVVEYSSANAFVACVPPPGNGFTMPSIPGPNNYGYRYVSAVDGVGRALYQVCGLGYPPQAPIVQGPGGVSALAPLLPATFTCP